MESFDKYKSNKKYYSTKQSNNSNRSLKNINKDNCFKSIQQNSTNISNKKGDKQNISFNFSKTIPKYRNENNIKSTYDYSKSYNNINNINIKRKNIIKINLNYKGKINNKNNHKLKKDIQYNNNSLLLSERNTTKNINIISNCNSEKQKNISNNDKINKSNQNNLILHKPISNYTTPKTTRKKDYNKNDLENNNFKNLENKIKELQNRINNTKKFLYINSTNFNDNYNKNYNRELPLSTKRKTINVNSNSKYNLDKDRKSKKLIKNNHFNNSNNNKDKKIIFDSKYINNKDEIKKNHSNHSLYTILNYNDKFKYNKYNNNHNIKILPKKKTSALNYNKNNILIIDKFLNMPIKNKKYNSKNRSKNNTPNNILRYGSIKKVSNAQKNYIYNNYMIMTPNKKNKIDITNQKTPHIETTKNKKIFFSNKTSKSMSNTCKQFYSLSSSYVTFGERNNKKIVCIRNKKIKSPNISIITSKKINKNEIIHKKIIKNASICRIGKNRENEPERINQDSLFKIKYEYLNLFFYGVCDGHGPFGHLVSNFIKNNLPIILYQKLKSNIYDNNNLLYNAIKDSFLQINYQLNYNSNIDINFSGSTCISVLFSYNQIITANVGDSRAIRGQYLPKNKKWIYEVLSKDHKPKEKEEYLRIKKYNGIIHPYLNEDKEFIGPQRVWIKNKNIPGLGISRTFGDKAFSSVGVISIPEIFFFKYNINDKFIVIASDGLWMYVSNQEIVEIVGKYYESFNSDQAIEELYILAKSRFEENDDYIDDITIIILFLV